MSQPSLWSYWTLLSRGWAHLCRWTPRRTLNRGPAQEREGTDLSILYPLTCTWQPQPLREIIRLLSFQLCTHMTPVLGFFWCFLPPWYTKLHREEVPMMTNQDNPSKLPNLLRFLTWIFHIPEYCHLTKESCPYSIHANSMTQMYCSKNLSLLFPKE